MIVFIVKSYRESKYKQIFFSCPITVFLNSMMFYVIRYFHKYLFLVD